MDTTKIALVTGASRGLGRDMALRIAERGLDLIITYHTQPAAAEAVAAEIRALGRKARTFRLDTREIGSFEAFFQEVGRYLKEAYGQLRFDVLVNNAGTGIYKPFTETTEADFDEMMQVHLKGVYFLTQKALPYLNDGGRIINISSGLARFTFPGSSAYASMKGGVDVFTRYLAKELAGRKITANSVAPGAVGTDFGNGENLRNLKKRELVAGLTALGRVGVPEDIGGVVAFLCTDDARWINGQRLEVSGGIML
jgi:NAD(P)-dependent dehydrogenase (short-subunit alcohol dehydrogenase family)